MRRSVPGQQLALDHALDHRVHQGLVAHIVELRLHLLPVMRGHQGELLMEPGERLRARAAPAPGSCPCAAATASGADDHLGQTGRLAGRLQLSHHGRCFVGAKVGAAHQVGDGEAGEAAKPGHGQHALADVPRPQAFDALEQFQVAATDLRATGCSTWPPPTVQVADDSRTTNGWPQTTVAGSSRNSWARPHCPGSMVSQSSSETVAIHSEVPA